MGILAAFANVPAPSPALELPAFTSLMNLLLSPASDSAQIETEPIAATRPAQQIADAMIRSMLGGVGQTSNMYTDVPAKPGQAAKKQAAASTVVPGSAVATAPVAPAAFASPILHPALPQVAPLPQPATAQNNPGTKLPPGASVIQAPAQLGSSLNELAFALRLTPLNAAENAGTAPPQTPLQNSAAPPAPIPTPLQSQPASTAPAADQPGTMQADPKQPELPRDTNALPAAVKAHAASDANSDVTPIVTAAAAAAGHTNEFAQALAQATPAVPGAPASAQESAPAVHFAEAIRTSEPAPVQPAPALHTGAAQEIAVRISRPDSPSVDVHFVERAGQVQVSVRTPDAGLQTSLRQDLGTLVNSLERTGYRAESLTAAPAGSPSISSTSQPGSAQNHSDHSEPGNSPRDSQGQAGQQQQRRDQRPQKWIEELEKQA